MARFVPLEVTEVRKTIRDAVAVTLRPVNAEDFSFVQGQYLTFRRSFDGTEIRRSYSICTGVQDDLLQVGIKRVNGGAFSTWANRDLAPGMVLEAMPPMGRFHVPLEPGAARSYLGFAGGSGITPLLSIIKTTLVAEPLSRFTLVYANRSVQSIMFREELEDLKNLYMGRLTIVHILETGAEDVPLFQGRVDGAKCAALFASLIDLGAVDTAFICGPEPMMRTITAALKDNGLSADRIKFELFASGQPGRLPRARGGPVGAGADLGADLGVDAATVTVILDGASHQVAAGPGQSVLEAALSQDIDAPFACKAGVCSTCRCKLVSGEVDMIANHALEDYEVEQGFVLSCQSYPVTDEVTVDYDRH